MVITRRRALVCIIAAGLAPIASGHPKNYLLGTFYLQCPYCGNIDKVEDGTAQHRCQTCDKQVFHDGKVIVMCPNGHPNEIALHGRTSSIICRRCQTECRRDGRRRAFSKQAHQMIQSPQ